jgi:hypothetical protein
MNAFHRLATIALVPVASGRPRIRQLPGRDQVDDAVRSAGGGLRPEGSRIAPRSPDISVQRGFVPGCHPLEFADRVDP